MAKITLTKNSSNEEILKQMPQLNDGDIVIFSIEKSASGNSMVAYTAQVAQGTGEVTLDQEEFLGWGSILLRKQQRIGEGREGSFSVGMSLKGDLLLTESLEPFYEGQPAYTNKAGQEITSGGLPIYTNTERVAQGEGGINRLPHDVIAAPAKVATTATTRKTAGTNPGAVISARKRAVTGN